MILIVAHLGDLHADVVTGVLTSRGAEPVRIQQEDLLRSVRVTARPGGSAATEVVTDAGPIDMAEVRAVWWRRQRSYQPPQVLPDGVTDSMVRQETRYAMDGIWRMLADDPGRYWMSRPDRIRSADNKPQQLLQAAAMGFRVPRTLLSNDPLDVREFHAQCGGRIIYKPLTDGFVFGVDGHRPDEPWDMLYTSTIDDKELAMLDTVRVSPCLFQEHIPKDRELRVTVLDDQVFTCALHSQEDERSSVDWRHQNANFRYSVEHIPDDLRDTCIRFTRSYGLNFGAFDFIVTPEGEYVFLEMNPNGQWLFAQLHVPQLTMVQALADILIRNGG